jgi:hypothetical protein
MPSSIAGLENFSLGTAADAPDTADYRDADSFFNLPDAAKDDDEDDDESPRR